MTFQDGISGITWGSVGGILLKIKGIIIGTTMLNELVTTKELFSTSILAAVGAIVGFFVTLGLKNLAKKWKGDTSD